MMVSMFLFLLLPVAIQTLSIIHIAPAALSPTTTAAAPAQAPLPQDCDDIFKSGTKHSGVYSVYPRGYGRSVQVYCDMDCEDVELGGGWTVFQKRFDGTVNFYRPWNQYKSGFGNVSGEHWLGLENLFAIAWQKNYMLRVDMEDFEGGSVHALYKSFYIESESDGYKLRLDTYVDGGAGDSLRYSNGLPFSTFDHGPYSYYAEKYHGGFWHSYNAYAHPNGLYSWGRYSNYRTGILWVQWKSYYYSLKAITMKIKPLPPDY